MSLFVRVRIAASMPGIARVAEAIRIRGLYPYVGQALAYNVARVLVRKSWFLFFCTAAFTFLGAPPQSNPVNLPFAHVALDDFPPEATYYGDCKGVGDIDGDGYIDIIGANWGGPHHPLVMWENKLIDRSALRTGAERPEPAAGLAFEHVVIDASGPQDIWLKAAGDLNGDGRPDLVAGGRNGGGLVFYENPSWKKIQVAVEGAFSTDGEVADMDGDGDRDLVALTTKELLWYENPRWRAHLIDTVVLHDVEVADFDGDGRLDVVGRNQGAFGPGGDILHIYRQGPSTSWVHQTIAIPSGEGLLAADIDRDKDLDVIAGPTWVENIGDASVSAWRVHTFGGKWRYPHTFVAAGDLNGDGRIDVILAPSERAGGTFRISWFEAPPDPKAGEWREHVLEDPVETVHHFIGAADFDGDGRADVATASMHQGKSPEISIYLNRNAGGRWLKHIVASRSSHSMRILDVDGDGRPDLYGANWQGRVVELWRNARPGYMRRACTINRSGAGPR